MSATPPQNAPPKKRAPVWAKAFLANLAESGVARTAAEAAGVDNRTPHRLRERDPEFAAAWEAALDQAADLLEREAIRRARDGWDEPVFGSRGGTGGVGTVGVIRKYSDTLLIFLLKGARPEKYRERFDQKVSGSIDVNAAILSAHRTATGGS